MDAFRRSPRGAAKRRRKLTTIQELVRSMPAFIPKDDNALMEDAKRIAEAIVGKDAGTAEDTYWISSARTLMEGIILHTMITRGIVRKRG
jgi:hypothetical protein